jgi:hypothetical protein
MLNETENERKKSKATLQLFGIESETEISIDISSRFLQATIKLSYETGC